MDDGKIFIKTPEQAETALRVFSGFLGPAGNAIKELIDHHSRVNQKRLNEFIKLLANELTKKGIIEKQLLEREEFGDLFQSVIFRVCGTSSESKIERFKKILINSLLENFDHDFNETYLDLVSRLDENHIRILKEHHKALPKLDNNSKQLRDQNKIKEVNQNLLTFKGSETNEYIEDPKIIFGNATQRIKELLVKREAICDVFEPSYYSLPESKLKFYLQDLYSKSLVYNPSLGLASDTGQYNRLQITEFGIEFLEFLKE